MNKLMSVLPIVVGALFAYVLIARPGFLKMDSPVGMAVGVAAALLLLLGFIFAMVLMSLPSSVRIEVLPQARLDRDMIKLVAQFEALGFVRVTPGVLRVHVAPPAEVVGLIHEELSVYGTVYRTGTTPPKLNCDIVSVLDVNAGDIRFGGLTTNPEPGGAAIPVGPGSFAQVFPRTSIEDMFTQHLRALGYLHERNIKTRPLSREKFPEHLREALAHQRRVFLSSPFNIFRVLWRSITKVTPHSGPIENQRIARRSIDEITRLRMGL